MNFPENIKYAKSHEWVRLDGSLATIGITDFAQSELGEIVFYDPQANVGDAVNAGEVFGAIEAVKTVSDVYSPVSGKVVEINSALDDTPEVVNSDPYGDGWLMKVEIVGDMPELMDAAAYQAMVGH